MPGPWSTKDGDALPLLGPPLPQISCWHCLRKWDLQPAVEDQPAVGNDLNTCLPDCICDRSALTLAR